MKKKSKKEKQKKTKYNKQKYASFNTMYQVHNRKELLEIDYLDKLSEEEKDWLNRFLQETVVTNFNHPGEQIITDDDKKRELYRENNRRNSDLLNKAKAGGKLVNLNTNNDYDCNMIDRVTEKNFKYDGNEDRILTQITLKRYIEESSDSEDK